MSSFSEEQKNSLISSTREAAIALMEDMRHIRETISVFSPPPDAMRRLSPILRRLLIEADLRFVAAPRIGRLLFLTEKQPERTLDKEAIYHQDFGFNFIGAGGLGVTINEHDDDVPRPHPAASEQSAPKPTAEPNNVELNLASFLAQKTVYYRGDWFSRGQLLSYAANIGGGVHSGTARPKEEKISRKIQKMVGDVGWSFEKNSGSFRLFPKPTEYNPKELSPVLAELLSTSTILVTSPMVLELERIIHSELGVPSVGLAAKPPSPNTPRPADKLGFLLASISRKPGGRP